MLRSPETWREFSWFLNTARGKTDKYFFIRSVAVTKMSCAVYIIYNLDTKLQTWTSILFLSLSLPLSLYALSCTDIFLIPSIYISVSNLTKTYIYISHVFSASSPHPWKSKCLGPTGRWWWPAALRRWHEGVAQGWNPGLAIARCDGRWVHQLGFRFRLGVMGPGVVRW